VSVYLPCEDAHPHIVSARSEVALTFVHVTHSILRPATRLTELGILPRAPHPLEEEWLSR